MKKIISKFDSYCQGCRGDINSGESVMWEKGRGVWHLCCDPNKKASTALNGGAVTAIMTTAPVSEESTRDETQTFMVNLRYGMLVLKIKDAVTQGHINPELTLDEVRALIAAFEAPEVEAPEVEAPEVEASTTGAAGPNRSKNRHVPTSTTANTTLEEIQAPEVDGGPLWAGTVEVSGLERFAMLELDD